MDACLERDPICLAEEGANGSGISDSTAAVPYFCSCFVSPCRCVFEGRHAEGKKVEVVYVCCEIQVVIKNPLGFMSVRLWVRMAVLNYSLHTCHSKEGLHQTLPIPRG